MFNIFCSKSCQFTLQHTECVDGFKRSFQSLGKVNELLGTCFEFADRVLKELLETELGYSAAGVVADADAKTVTT